MSRATKSKAALQALKALYYTEWCGQYSYTSDNKRTASTEIRKIKEIAKAAGINITIETRPLDIVKTSLVK